MSFSILHPPAFLSDPWSDYILNYAVTISMIHETVEHTAGENTAESASFKNKSLSLYLNLVQDIMVYSRFRIICSETLDSTNEEAKRRMDSLPDLSVVSAYVQTSGRGQRGNTWLSEPYKNLTFSIVVKRSFNIEPAKQFVINEMISLAIVDLLSGYGIDARIKWPNDIYVGDKKICGILIEHAVRGNLLAHSIIGVGLNVNQSNFDASLYNPTSMSLETGGKQISLQPLLEEFLNVFYKYVEGFSVEDLKKLYHSKLWKLDETASFFDYTTLPEGYHKGPSNIDSAEKSISGSFCGVIKGVTDAGNLLVEVHDSGIPQLREFGFKEIGYKF